MYSYEEMLSRVSHGRSTINFIKYIELTYFIFTFEYIPHLFSILIHSRILRGSHPRDILSNKKIPLMSFTDKIYETQRISRIKFVIRNHNTADTVRSIDSRFMWSHEIHFAVKKGMKEEKKNNRIYAHIDIKEFHNISEVNKSLFAETINANKCNKTSTNIVLERMDERNCIDLIYHNAGKLRTVIYAFIESCLICKSSIIGIIFIALKLDFIIV